MTKFLINKNRIHNYFHYKQVYLKKEHLKRTIRKMQDEFSETIKKYERTISILIEEVNKTIAIYNRYLETLTFEFEYHRTQNWRKRQSNSDKTEIKKEMRAMRVKSKGSTVE